MVRRAGVEPAWSYPLDPKSSVSTNFTTLAFLFFWWAVQDSNL